MVLSDPRTLEIFYTCLMVMSLWQVTNGAHLMYALGSFIHIHIFHINQPWNRCFPMISHGEQA